MNNSIQDFIAANPTACKSGQEWALANCKTMAEVWDRIKPEWLIWIATRPNVLDDRTLRLFACHCVRETPLVDGRKVWDLLEDERFRNAVIVAERFAEGKATLEELNAARAAVRYAACDADSAARAAARADACAAVSAAVNACDAAARADACDAASAAVACYAAYNAQALFLRELPNPFQSLIPDPYPLSPDP